MAGRTDGRLIPALFGSNNKLPLSYEQRLAALANRKRINEAIRAQSLQPTDGGKMVSGHYIADPWSGLANMAKAYIGRKGVESSEEEEAALVAERQAEFERAINEVPQDIPDAELRGAPGEQELPTMIPGKKSTPQDWVKWGGRLSQLGPQGQAIGGAAIERAVGSLLPKLPGLHDWKEAEIFDPETGRPRKVLWNPKDPTAKPIPIGGVSDEKGKPTTLDQRLALATERQSIVRKALIEGRSLTAEQADRIAAIDNAMRDISLLATADGGVVAGSRAGAVAPHPGGAVPGTPAQPGMVPQPGMPAQPGMVPPTAPTITGKFNFDNAKPGEVEAALRDAAANGQTPPKPAPGMPEVSAAQTKDVDPYAKYRDDPRNAPYIPQPVGPGMTVVRPGTGAQQKLNADVAKLGEDVVKENIDTFDDAWKDFRKTFAAAREKVSGLKGGEDTRNLLEKGWDSIRIGGGAGGPAGVYNSLPQFLNTPAGQDLKRAIERIKAFERHRLFGATLTGNEKTSFEALAGTQFGVSDEQLLNAMTAMERQFNESKKSLFGKYAPIVVDEFQRGRARGSSNRQEPWLKLEGTI